MRDILISSAVCLACLMVALVSQLLAPVPANAQAAPAPAGLEQAVLTSRPSPAAAPASASASAAVVAPLELDPNDPNPSLFTMAVSGSSSAASSEIAQAASLGGEITAPKERVTASGLRITDLEEGTGAEAVAGQTVSVHYRGSLTNGKEFDSSYGRGPFSFRLGGGQVIQGWDEGVAGMKVGGKRRLVIPPELGYGARGAGGVIPPDATLLFDVELLKVGG
jgi:hypothetical protein